MESYHWGFSGSDDGCGSGHESVSAYSDPNLITGFQLKDMNRDNEFVNLLPTSNDPVPPIHSTVLSDSWSGDSAEEYDFCDSVLNYINQVLMEDDMEDKASVIQDSTLHAAEKYFHDILNDRYHSSPHLVRPQEETSRCQCCSSYGSSSADANNPVKSSVIRSPHVHHSPFVHHAFQTNLPPVSSTSFSSHCVSNAPSESQSSWQFHGAIENAKNIIPGESGVTFNCENRFVSPAKDIIPGESGVTFNCENRFVSPAKEKVWQMNAKLEKEEGNCPESLLRGRKSLHREGSALDEGRSHKHLAVDVGESILHEIFDKVLSFDESAIHTSDGDLPTEAGGKQQQYERAKVYDDEITYTKKGVTKREALDTRKLLIQCMQSVAGNDQTTTTKLLKQIRLRSSPQGDASQRLAHYFANGLEARLTGSRIPEEKLFSIKGFVPPDVCRAHKLYVSAFPFLGISYFVATQMIMELAEKATGLHIIHFGIKLGLQWPPLIRRLSKRPGGPPKLRITAIDLPQIGFQPDTRIKETGQRLATYCEKFKVPFEYNSFGQKWETVLVEDLRIQNDELLVVNSLNQFQDLLDDSIMDHSPRDAVLNLIRKINPDLFIHGVVNGTYNSPFFISRFREALFHFSAWFDMLDANVPRDNKERMALERDQWGKEILNIIACEGLDRVERLETYKQWEIRTLRAGFRQMPFNQEILEEVRVKVRSSYHKDFFVDKANKWIVNGWKGRPFFAISSWKPA